MSERKIRLLDDTTINQIAAGEVIENAASVVKELVENALDANASCITVETKSDFIRVIDDGCGIEEADLPLACERHATSKILSIHDLDLLKSLGFRGEALASIASVSKLSILTSSDNFGTGHYFETHGGTFQKKKIHPRQKGTTIEVRALFYNVPVRKKFLKSERVETSAILKVLTMLALCNPNVAFKWIHQDKVQFAFEREDILIERIKALLGKDVALSQFHVEQEEEPFSLNGFTAKPHLHRPNKSGQFLFINGRAVSSPFVSAKVLKGYSTRLPTHRFPVFVLKLQLPLNWIDVNVHPQKKEIRFRDEEKLGKFLVRAIEVSLQSEEKPAPVMINMPPLVMNSEFSFMEKIEGEPFLEEKDSQLHFSSKFHILGKMGFYLFVEREGNFLVVDLKRARSRVVFEGLKKKSVHSVQHLLLPVNLEFTESEKLQLLDSTEALNEMGIGIRFFGNKTFIVDSIPNFLNENEIRSVILAFLDGEKTQKEKAMASKVQKSNFSYEEAKLIVERLFQCAAFEETADGKKTILTLTEKELEKKFDE